MKFKIILLLNWMRCGVLLKAETTKYGFGLLWREDLAKFHPTQ